MKVTIRELLATGVIEEDDVLENAYIINDDFLVKTGCGTLAGIAREGDLLVGYNDGGNSITVGKDSTIDVEVYKKLKGEFFC